MPDGYQREYCLSRRTWLVTAIRASAPIHAFGAPVRSETRVADNRSLNGALFPIALAIDPTHGPSLTALQQMPAK